MDYSIKKALLEQKKKELIRKHNEQKNKLFIQYKQSMIELEKTQKIEMNQVLSEIQKELSSFKPLPKFKIVRIQSLPEPSYKIIEIRNSSSMIDKPIKPQKNTELNENNPFPLPPLKKIEPFVRKSVQYSLPVRRLPNPDRDRLNTEQLKRRKILNITDSKIKSIIKKGNKKVFK
jgi:hypothetical protein